MAGNVALLVARCDGNSVINFELQQKTGVIYKVTCIFDVFTNVLLRASIALSACSSAANPMKANLLKVPSALYFKEQSVTVP